jgi:glycosyltransferase involved in cell wall biosynthesis
MLNQNDSIVSIICACYNQEKYIYESLESVKNQTFQNFELIIWDDASKDNSVGVIESWIKNNPQYSVHFVKHTINKGICASLNECFLISKGKYIQILALDDVILPFKLEKHVNLLEKSDRSDGLVFTDAFIMDENSNRYQNKFIAYHHQYLSLESGNYFERLLKSNFIPAMSVLLKREVIHDIGLWDEDLLFEDYDMWLRISRKYNFIFDDEVSVVYRLHSNNTHKTISDKLLVSSFKMYLKYSDIPSIKKKLRAIIEHNYIYGESRGEEKLFFEKEQVKSLQDKLIISRGYVTLFRILRKLKIFYESN